MTAPGKLLAFQNVELIPDQLVCLKAVSGEIEGNPDTAEIGDVLIDFLYIPVRNRALGIAVENLAFLSVPDFLAR
mgnify:CR=1 FL=1